MIEEKAAEPQPLTEGKKAYQLMQESGFIGCVEMEEDLSETYKEHLDWSHKV